MFELPEELLMKFQEKSNEVLTVVVEIYNEGIKKGLEQTGGGFTQEQVDAMILEAVSAANAVKEEEKLQALAALKAELHQKVKDADLKEDAEVDAIFA